MANFTFSRYIFVLMLFALISNITVSQEAMYEVKLHDQVKLSNQIVEGKVISKQSFWDDSHENIYTSHIIEVYKVFKGQPSSTIEVITEGGIVDLEAQVVSSSLELRNGDLGVFILSDNVKNINKQTNGRKLYKSVSNSQGFYKYSLELNKAVNTMNAIDGITSELYNELTKYTDAEIMEVKSINVENEVQLSFLNRTSSSKIASPDISSFSSTNTSAGTKSVLTINGSGFGSVKGTIGFSDADYGGYIHNNALDNQVLSWTDSKIEVEIPDLAGTGTFKVNTVSNGSVISSTVLPISFAQINLNYNAGSGDMAYQTQHVNNNGNGGNTWIMNQDFYNSAAKASFERAFSTWSCQTGINWEIATTTSTINKNANDGVNIISFDNTMASGTLGQCFSRYSGCYDNGEIKWYVTEMDIVFNGNKNWNFSTNPATSSQIDFESVVLHELGHGHQLGHVVDTNVVMHYSLSAGETQRSLSAEDLSGAIDVQTRNSTTSICNQLEMTNSSCSLLSTDEFDLNEGIKIFPNPASGKFFIKNVASLNIEKIGIYNLEGRVIYQSLEKNSFRSKSINITNLSNGMYFVKIDTEYGVLTHKLIVK